MRGINLCSDWEPTRRTEIKLCQSSMVAGSDDRRGLGNVVQVFDCVRHDHDLWLVLLAGLVCLCGIYASFALADHAIRSGRKTRSL
ncbi:hypothetical protein WR25_07849 [Diploscapter pachys]|uniref:Uncharacterized protein n=1 Tax=Diploscapter pachys TaxID=2018661 RepID=A0A2A2M4Z6_9BILA|nr:hypothetical protein WR25_07849 [Diploscapter pachys]